MQILSILRLLLLVPVVLCATVPTGFTPDQMKFLDGDPPVTHLVRFDISQAKEDGGSERFGSLDIALFGETVPITVNKFVQQSLKTGGYMNLLFHRVIKNFVVQGGDLRLPGPDYGHVVGEHFDDENFVLKHNKQGRLSMANAGPNTNLNQFFITTGPDGVPRLDGSYVVFGQLVLGHDVLEKMQLVETGEGDRPKADLYVSNVAVRDLSQMEMEMQSVSPNYMYFIFFCGILALLYCVLRYNRRLYVDLASFRE